MIIKKNIIKNKYLRYKIINILILKNIKLNKNFFNKLNNKLMLNKLIHYKEFYIIYIIEFCGIKIIITHKFLFIF